MQRFVLSGISVALLALTYAALDDITTGREPSFALEWSMVVATAIWFSVLAASILRRKISGR